MPEERVCPSCKETVESGALYCGNCGYQLEGTSSPLSSVYAKGGSQAEALPLSMASMGPSTPSYAVPYTHHKQHWGAMALAFGILGIGASALIPILGIGFGVIGLILITSSYKVSHNWLRLTGLIVSILALLIGIGFWVNALEHDPKLEASSQAGTSSGVAAINVNTPCYSLTFNTELNVNNASGSCSMNAYNGSTLDDSSNVYKIEADTTSTVTGSNFDAISKQAIEQDIAKNLPNFSLTSEASGIFDGSPSYTVKAYDDSANVAFLEEAVFRNTLTSSQNFFVLIHAVNGSSVNLNNIEKSWQWND